MMNAESTPENGCSRPNAAMIRRGLGVGFLLVSAAITPWLSAFGDDQPPKRPVADRMKVDPARPVPGTLFISGGGRLPESSLLRFIEYGGGDRCRLVVITTASETADTPEIEPRIAPFRRLKLADLCFLHTRDRETANDHGFCRPLEDATAVWFIGGHQNRLTEAYLDTLVEQQLRRILERGGVIGGTSAGAAIMSQVMIKGGNPEPELDRGFGFLPGTVVDQHFLKRHRQERLLNALSAYPELVGLGIDEGTTLVVQGRTMTVLDESDSQVMTCLVGTHDKPHRTQLLAPGAETDLLALARSAKRRTQVPPAPPQVPGLTELSRGTLVVVGGGEVPAEAAERFVEAAGGESASIVVITTAYGEKAPEEADTLRWLEHAGARNVISLHISTREEAADPKILAAIDNAGGVWFMGGRQWRLIDAIEDTPAEKALRGVLARNGAVGGNAAGASVLASYLVRGNPVTNRQIIGEGYEDGFGFLRGAAIDPYFTQRNRRGDMAHLKRTHPELIGLGIDAGTALVIQGRTMDVYGRNMVSVYDRTDTDQQSEDDFEPLMAGDRYDLIARSRVGSVEDDRDRTVVALDSAADDETPEPNPPLVCE